MDYELMLEIIKIHRSTIDAVYAADTASADEQTKEISFKIEGLAPKKVWLIEKIIS